MNWYIYCGNDPINAIDPTGLAVWLIHGTWAKPGTWKQNFRTYIKGFFNNETVYALPWERNKRGRIINGKNTIASREKGAQVVVPDYQLSLAIGKEGQNARLAAKLTGWKIDIKSENQVMQILYEEFNDYEPADYAEDGFDDEYGSSDEAEKYNDELIEDDDNNG